MESNSAHIAVVVDPPKRDIPHYLAAVFINFTIERGLSRVAAVVVSTVISSSFRPTENRAETKTIIVTTSFRQFPLVSASFRSLLRLSASAGRAF